MLQCDVLKHKSYKFFNLFFLFILQCTSPITPYIRFAFLFSYMLYMNGMYIRIKQEVNCVRTTAVLLFKKIFNHREQYNL